MKTVKSLAEQKVIHHNVSWGTYERLMEERGESRVPRFAFGRGELEIMSPQAGHESISYAAALLVEVLAEEMDIDVYGLGSTTFKREDLERGFEPDQCFYIKDWELVHGKAGFRHRSAAGVGDRDRYHQPVTEQTPDLCAARRTRNLALRRRKVAHPRAGG
jgi:Uma2 family endonuclease